MEGMRKHTFIAAAAVAILAAVAPLADAQERQRYPSRAEAGGGQGGQDRGGRQESGGRARAAEPRQQAPREQVAPPQARDNDRGGNRAAEQARGQDRDGDRGRRVDGRDRDRDRDGRYAVPRAGSAPRGRDGDRRVYVQPRRNYYVYRYPSYRYAAPFGYYGYSHYDPYFRGDFYWSNHTWQSRSYYYGGSYDSDLGKLRLDMEPREAEVYIDGYYAGVVDDFDGRLQGLRLEAGNYAVEVVLPGFAPLQFDVHVSPGRTTTYRGELLRD
jgi:hypothetical protein